MTMKTTKAFLFLILFTLLAFPRTAFAQELLDVSEFSDSSDSGFLSGDLVSSFADSASEAAGDAAGDLAGTFTGDLIDSTLGSAMGNIVGGDVVTGMVSDWASDKVSGWVSDKVSGWVSDNAGGFLGSLAGDMLSIPEISNIIGSLDDMASAMKGALVGPNIPYYRVLWMFSGESVINEIDSLFSGDYSNLEEGLGKLKEMF